MKIKKNIAVSENGFVFVPDTGDSYTLNSIAAEIIHALKENKQREEIIEMLLSKYDAERLEVERDLDDFIAQLIKWNLLDNENYSYCSQRP